MLATLALTWLALATPAQTTPPPPKPHVIVFLDRVAEPPTYSAVEQTRILGEHLTNMQVMYEKRDAFLIGPFEESAPYHGILIMNMSRDAAVARLAEDPLVKAGLANPVVIPVSADVTVFKQADDFLEQKNRQLVIFRDRRDVPPMRPEALAKIQADTALRLTEFEEKFWIPYRGLPDMGEIREIWVVDTEDGTPVRAFFANDPRVENGLMEVQVLTFKSTRDTFLAQPPRAN